jgi:bifunctional ADP-heptose synthase (sugar kinase/adenylyltransferase)
MRGLLMVRRRVKRCNPEGLDTRSKIVSWEDAKRFALDRRAAIVVGHFDPLVVSHVRNLATIRSRHDAVVAVVTNSEKPILPARARAEMLSALRLVDRVVNPGEYPLDELERIPGVNVLREEVEDRRRLESLIHYVASRHQQVVR